MHHSLKTARRTRPWLATRSHALRHAARTVHLLQNVRVHLLCCLGLGRCSSAPAGSVGVKVFTNASPTVDPQHVAPCWRIISTSGRWPRASWSTCILSCSSSVAFELMPPDLAEETASVLGVELERRVALEQLTYMADCVWTWQMACIRAAL